MDDQDAALEERVTPGDRSGLEMSPRQPPEKRKKTETSRAAPEQPGVPGDEAAINLLCDLKWLAHTVNLEATRKGIKQDMSRSIQKKIEDIGIAANEVLKENAILKARLEEARGCNSNLVARLGAWFHSPAAVARRTTDVHMQIPTPILRDEIRSFAEVAREGGEGTRATARSRSRTNRREASRVNNNKALLKDKRETTPPPAYIIEARENRPDLEAKRALWEEVSRKTKAPKLQLITAKSSKMVIKPMDKETNDILKKIARKKATEIKEEPPKWPRVIVTGVESGVLPNELATQIAEQNPELGIGPDREKDLVPIFKRGQRERPTVSWVLEVKPDLYNLVSDTALYVSFMRCRTRPFEEITQCLKCLLFGHPASLCNAMEQLKCAHCAGSGHKSPNCPDGANTPKCVNCGGNHNAMMRSCSARATALANVLLRTDIPKTAQ